MSQVQHFAAIVADLESKVSALQLEETRIINARSPLQLAAHLGDAEAVAQSEMLRVDLVNTRAQVEDAQQAYYQARFRLAEAEKDAAAERRAAQLEKGKALAAQRAELAEKIDEKLRDFQGLFASLWDNTKSMSALADVTGVTGTMLWSSHRVDRAAWTLAPDFAGFMRLPRPKPGEFRPLADAERALLQNLLGRQAPQTEIDRLIGEEEAGATGDNEPVTGSV